MSNRGYGFIDYDESEKDLFFHSSNFQSTETPSENQKVEFRVIDTPKGKEAVDVQLVMSNFERVSDEEDESEVIPVQVNELSNLDGIGPKYRELLEATGIKSVNSLSENTPEELLTNLLAVNETKEITKRPPTLPLVEKWIQTAGNLR
jgi:CspA family cold shock protein